MKIFNLTAPKIICLLITLFFQYPAQLSAQMKVLQNGDKISFDGEYYDFRDSAGIQMIKMWIPPKTKVIRGVFISGHGGGGGDSRDFARDENIRAFAMRLGFAVAGLHNFPGRNIYDNGCRKFFGALTEFSKLGQHPEIAYLPFVMYGSSNGGAQTYGFINYAPERAICFVSNVAAGGNPQTPVDPALKVPGVFIIGKFDALMGQRAIDRTAELVGNGRAKGARWCWALEMKGHEDGCSFDIYMKLVEQAVRARYPKDASPLNGPVKLNELQEESGWLVDHDSWGSGLTQVASYEDYKGDKVKAGWVLNKDLAFVYRSLATHHNPISVKVQEFDRTYNPNTDPGTMFSLGGPVAMPGDKITLHCIMENFPSWEKLEFYNGSVLLGEVLKGNTPEITCVLEGKTQVYCLTVLATDATGKQVTCNPMHFFVKDPGLSWNTDRPNPVFKGIKTNAGSVNAERKLMIQAPASPSDSLLIAYGLTASMEKHFSSVDNRISDFWKLIDDKKDFILLTPRRNGKTDAAFNAVLTHDCNMKVKAAYGADGLYLLFEINDDNDVAWPNQFTGTENEQFYLNFDVVDVLLDSRSIAEICQPANRDIFVSRGFGLTATTKQYQIACGTPEERPKGFRRALPDPWDFNAKFVEFDNARKEFGMQVENIKTDYYDKAQEWFIPWSEIGTGIPAEPAALTSLAFSVGYNDRDEGEHFPPGVTSSGGSVKASNALRWINRSDPWGSDKAPYNWGELILGPMLSQP
jgi:hypothetical protein